MKKSNEEVPPKSSTIFEFDILWSGWDCDSTGYIRKDDEGNNVLVLTSHGDEYLSDKSELIDQIEAYKQVIKETEKALGMLK
jgi:glutamine synthetase type III